MSKVFPPWFNRLPLQFLVFAGLLVSSVLLGATYYLTPKYTRVGYQPQQPVPFSHALHNGQLGLDCRYCHSHVEQSGHANVPSANTCMNCHSAVKKDSPLLAAVRRSFDTGEPVPWVKVHQAPHYVYFNHSVHVNRGVSCVQCHGQINEMDERGVRHEKPLSMSFCLDCHRAPETALRPNSHVFDLTWSASSPEEQLRQGQALKEAWKVNPPLSCSGCHR